MKIISVLFISCILLLSSCNEIDPKGESEVKAFVQKWNNNHTTLRASYLTQHYMDVVQYYDLERTKNQIQQDKTVLFERFPDFTQTIKNNEITVVEEAGNFLATFVKTVSYDDVEAEYDAYLAVIYKNGAFKILREGVIADAEALDAPIFPKARENDQRIMKSPRLYGDFNGDALSDFAYVDSPIIISKDAKNRLSDNKVLCKGGCVSTIRFSFDKNKSFDIEEAYESQLENLKDLNGDGADELGFWDLKEKSKSLYVFDVANNTLMTPPIRINTAVHKNLKLIDVIKKSGVNKITVTESVLENGNWVLKSRIIEL